MATMSMSEIGEQLVQAMERLDQSRLKLEEVELPFRKQIREHKLEMDRLTKEALKASKSEMTEVEAREAIAQEHKESLMKIWEGDKKQFATDNGSKITLRTYKGFDIIDEESLLKRCKDFEKPPFTPKWDRKILVTLIETGIIPKGEAMLTERQNVSVQLPKEEKVMTKAVEDAKE